MISTAADAPNLLPSEASTSKRQNQDADKVGKKRKSFETHRLPQNTELSSFLNHFCALDFV